MGYKCAPQMMGLVRGEPKPGQRHRANGKAILSEAGIERHSASETLDKTRSGNNRYEGFDSGFACWDAICDEADEYKVPTRLRDGTMAYRGLRHDAVVGIAVIFNPPHDMCAGWSQRDYERFYNDSFEVCGEIEPRIFRKENRRMRAVHCDEGRVGDHDIYDEHEHEIIVPRDTDGRYCGNLLDAQFFKKLNVEYPQRMRERGWALDDLSVTDWERMKTDEDYRAEKIAQRKKNGRSVNQYIKDQAMAELQNAQSMTQNAIEAEHTYLSARKKADADADAARRAAEEAEKRKKRRTQNMINTSIWPCRRKRNSLLQSASAANSKTRFPR